MTPIESLIAECERANQRVIDELGMGLIDVNAIERARAALAASPVPADLLRWVKAQADDPSANERFRELLAVLSAASPVPAVRAEVLDDKGILRLAERHGVVYQDGYGNWCSTKREDADLSPDLLEFSRALLAAAPGATMLNGLTESAASVSAPAQQAERECRHCGWLCRPNPAESQRWYPLTDPATAPSVEAQADENRLLERAYYELQMQGVAPDSTTDEGKLLLEIAARLGKEHSND